jgi:mono/diheme cytochrome c family protein
VWDAAKPIWSPALILMSVAKFGAVVGEFMHMRGDRRVYQFLFLSPLALAVVLFPLFIALSVAPFKPFGEGYVTTARDLKNGYVPPSKGPTAEPPLADDKFLAAFTEAQGKGFEKGKKVFGEKCVSCHGPEGGGMANLGVNLTDDCYKYGGGFKDLYLTIVNGQAGGKMPQWSSQLKSEEMRQVVYYVKSLKGKNVAGGQPCVGEKAAN